MRQYQQWPCFGVLEAFSAWFHNWPRAYASFTLAAFTILTIARNQQQKSQLLIIAKPNSCFGLVGFDGFSII